MDWQQVLSRTLEQRNLKDFEQALISRANPNLPDDNGITIYEKTLASAGCYEFIRICIRHGNCKADYINGKAKAAVNFASDSRDPRNIRELLNYPGVQVNNKYSDLTPLNSLAKNLNEDNVKNIKECMHLLIEYGAQPHIEDNTGTTPFHYVINNPKISQAERHELIQMMLKSPNVQLDDELIKDLRQWNPNLELPVGNTCSSNEDQRSEVTKKQLLAALNNGDEDQFISWLNQYSGNRSELLKECIAHGYHKAFDHLLMDTNSNIQENSKLYVDTSITYGNWYTLEKLLNHTQLISQRGWQLLHMVIARLDERCSKDFQNYAKCFQLLLEKSEHVDVNERDNSGRTCLHYAIIFNQVSAMEQLLKHGAHLGIRSQFNELSISDIDPLILKQHLDNCITKNELCRSDQNFEIRLKYESLKMDKGYSDTDVDMAPIYAMAKSQELQDLLCHPLINTAIEYKWNSIKILFYIYWWICVMINCLLIANLFAIFSSYLDKIKPTLLILSWPSIGCLVVKESISWYLWGICRSRLNRFLNIAIILVSIVSVIFCNPNESYSRSIASFNILLIATQLTHMVGMLPIHSWSVYVVIFRRVCWTFLTSCVPYSILILSFALSLYILNIHNSSEITISQILTKTITILTGEYNEGDIHYKHNYLDPLILLMYVFLLSIVLINLLTALAFDDTQAIRASAKVNCAVSLVNLLYIFDILLSKSWRCLDPICRILGINDVRLPDTIVIKMKLEPAHKIVVSKNAAYYEFPSDDQLVMHWNSKRIKPILQIIDAKS